MKRDGGVLLMLLLAWLLALTVLICGFCSPAIAQLPLQVKDGAVMENEEFLLQEIGKVRSVAAGSYATLAGSQTLSGENVFSSSATFSSAVSTITFSGWIDVGFVYVSSQTVTGSNVLASCAAGYRVITGGCLSQSSTYPIFASYPASASSWRCQATGAPGGPVGVISYAGCARVK